MSSAAEGDHSFHTHVTDSGYHSTWWPEWTRSKEAAMAKHEDEMNETVRSNQPVVRCSINTE